VTLLGNCCCHGNATIRRLFIIGVDIAVNNIEVFIIAMETQQWAFLCAAVELQNILVLLLTVIN
jgi:hypothetical protein